MQNSSLARRGTGRAVIEPADIQKLIVHVKTVAVVLHPTDWTTLDAAGEDGTLVDCDSAGVVEDVCRDAATYFRKGDRIAGFGHGDVESIFFLGYDMSGEAYMHEGDSYPAKPEAFTFGRRWYRTAEKLWASGKWQAHRQSVGKGGLMGMLDGLQMMRQGLVSGKKLGYRVEETE